jgi:hypothetical protein
MTGRGPCAAARQELGAYVLGALAPADRLMLDQHLMSCHRSDGSAQATYNGHPLYTYVADKAPGQAKDNGLNISGGLWHEVTVSGAAAPAPAHSSSSGGGGYGY